MMGSGSSTFGRRETPIGGHEQTNETGLGWKRSMAEMRPPCPPNCLPGLPRDAPGAKSTPNADQIDRSKTVGTADFSLCARSAVPTLFWHRPGPPPGAKLSLRYRPGTPKWHPKYHPMTSNDASPLRKRPIHRQLHIQLHLQPPSPIPSPIPSPTPSPTNTVSDADSDLHHHRTRLPLP